jgi:hypothetical protein
MRKIVFLLVIFSAFYVLGFQTKYYFAGKDWSAFKTQSPNHEKITTKSFELICKKQGDSSIIEGHNFINENLSKFIDAPLRSCEYEEIGNSIQSIKKGVGYNDHAEMDGFSAVLEDNFDLIFDIQSACLACLALLLCESTMPVFGTFGCGIIVSKLDPNDFSYSSQADLGNEDRYPFMHSQFNGRTTGEDPDIFFKIMRSYIKTYFYELVVLGLTSENTPENKFVSFNDVTQHSSTKTNDFIKTVEFGKILLGEILHAIEDSFAHNIRYFDENKHGEKIFKIGAIINMTTSNKTDYYKRFSHDNNFPPIETTCWNCQSYNDLVDEGTFIWNAKDVDNRGDYKEISDVNFPLNLNVFSEDGKYFTYDPYFMLEKFINMKYASTFASIAVADFLWKIGEAIEKIKAPDFDGNYFNIMEPSIDEYLERWFSDGTAIFKPKGVYLLGNYPEIKEVGRWENFYNIDLWVESRNEDSKRYKAVYLPWVTWINDDSFKNRWVFKTIENYPGRPGYIEDAENTYDPDTKTMTFKKSSLTIMWSWLDGSADKRTEVGNFADIDFLESIDPEEPVYELPLEDFEGREVSPAAIFIPRGFKVCLKYSTDGNVIYSQDDNAAARFWKMPTYRCFYGGDNGRLIAGGKEDALKPGTQIFVLPIDTDGDGIYDGKDNCPFAYNPSQNDLDGDGVGDVCDPDIDGDGVPNEEDNCPYLFNPNQLDSDGDDVGDACDACPFVHDSLPGQPIANYKPFINPFTGEIIAQWYWDESSNIMKMIDSDLDGVPDACDNCPHVPNPRIFASPHREIVVGPCDDPNNCDAGAAFMESTRNGGKIYTQGSYFLRPSVDWVNKKYTYKWEYVATPFYGWQRDHDLDGIGDVCDYKSVTTNGQGIDESRNPGTSTAKLGNVKGIETSFISPASQTLLTRYNSLYQIELYAAEWSVENSGTNIILENTVHFCGMPDEEYYDGDDGSKNWGKLGFCTNGSVSVDVDLVSYFCLRGISAYCYPIYESVTEVEFGYSHGTDPAVENIFSEDYKPWTHIAWKKDRFRAEKISAENIENARAPIWAMQGNANGPNIGNCIPALGNSGVGCSIYPYWNWRIDAFDYMNCANLQGDIKPFLCNQLEQDSASSINNAKVFHYALSAGAFGGNSDYILWDQTGRTINPDYFHNKKKYARSFRNSMNDDKAFTLSRAIEQVDISRRFPVFKDSHQPLVDSGVKQIAQWQVSDIKFRQFNKNLPEDYYALTSGHSNALYAVTRNDGGYFELYINYAEDINDWHFITAIPSWPEELELRGLDMVGDSLYFTGIDEGERESPFRIYRFNMNPAVMATTVVGELETPLQYARIFELNSGMYLSGINEGSLLIYSLSNNAITQKAQLPARFDYTITVNGSSVYIAGGTDENQMPYSDILVSRNSGVNWEIFTDLSNYQVDLSKSFVHFSGGKMFIINPEADVDSNVKKVVSIDLETGETVIEMTVPDGISFEYDYGLCVYENSGSILPGSIGYDGDCIPVYDYNYQTVAYFDYKKTIAGFGNNLYLGGLTGVRRVEIRNDGSLINRDMLYTGDTNNLVVYGNTMYGANYGEIDVYSIADNGSISRVKGINTSSCGNIRVSGDMLFAAENKRVRIFDLADPLNPLLIKTISTSGKVIDLEIVGENLFIYEETTSWFTTKGFTGIYDISNLNAPVRTKYFEKRCRDAEMQRSGNNSKVSLDEKVYLGCKNGQHRIEETGLVSVNGEKNYVREGYQYDKVLYQVFSGALHKSKAAPFFSLCGNGIIEPGEACDGDFVLCSDISSSYISGIAACNSKCDGYNTSVCESDGW